MRRIFIAGVLSLLLMACKSNPATKLDNQTERAIKGNWTITSVYYPGSEVIKITSFGIAGSECFEGSYWKFVSNNNKGEMSIRKAGCPAFSSPITWFVNAEGNMVIKITEGEKARKVDLGYVLRVANLYDNSFQLIERVNVAGVPTDVVYQFARL